MKEGSGQMKKKDIMKNSAVACLDHPQQNTLEILERMASELPEEESDFIAENIALLALAGEHAKRQSKKLQELIRHYR
jgi:hypothetical protein